VAHAQIHRTALVLLSLFVVACAPPPPADRGAALFETCQSCHGLQGEGNPDFRAPRIAGLPQWYLERQVTNFHEGIRGANPDDANGLRMRGMIRTLSGPEDIQAVVDHVAALPPPPASTAAVQGNAQHGATLYATCTQCHGEDGRGDETRGAPPIAGQDPWYVVLQLNSFKSGVRGTEPRDERGSQMRPMTLGLGDQDMQDVAAYVASLGGGS